MFPVGGKKKGRKKSIKNIRIASSYIYVPNVIPTLTPDSLTTPVLISYGCQWTLLEETLYFCLH